MARSVHLTSASLLLLLGGRGEDDRESKTEYRNNIPRRRGGVRKRCLYIFQSFMEKNVER